MAAPSAVEFAASVANVCHNHAIVQSYAVNIQDNAITKIRVDVGRGLFVDVFYNAVTGKISYALIESRVRLFGTDNTTSWHVHPFEDPDSHQPSAPVSFEDFLL